MLKGQDILVVLLLVSDQTKNWTQPEIAKGLGLSLGEVNNALKRAHRSKILRKPQLTLRINRKNLADPMLETVGLVSQGGGVSGFIPATGALEELLTYGVKFFLPPVWGNVARGIPTANAAPIMSEIIVTSEVPPVWEHPEGSVRGRSLEPIHENAPIAALKYPQLYDLLALTDAMRVGGARETSLARDLLHQRLRRREVSHARSQ